MKNPTYIVTGACGHLGNTIVKQLTSSGERVRALVLPGESRTALCDTDVEIIEGDVRDKDSLHPLFARRDDEPLIVIHCAGVVTVETIHMQSVTDINVGGTRNIVELCALHGVNRLVYVSSVHAIPELTKGRTICEIDRFDPKKVKGFYAKTKAAATDIVLCAAKDGLDAVVVHPSGIMGPNDFALGYSTQLVLEYLGGGLVAGIIGGYDFVDVRDVASGIISAAKRGRRGECYILSNTFISVRRMLDTLSDVSGMKKVKTMLPLWFIKPLAPLAELYYKILHKKPLFTGYSIYTLQSNANFSHEKATRELGYSTRDLRETLTDTVAFLKDHGRINRNGRKQPLRRKRPALSRS